MAPRARAATKGSTVKARTKAPVKKQAIKVAKVAKLTKVRTRKPAIRVAKVRAKKPAVAKVRAKKPAVAKVRAKKPAVAKVRAKKPAVAKVRAKKPAIIPKKKASKKKAPKKKASKKKTRAQALRDNRALRSRVKALRKKQQRGRGKPKKSPTRGVAKREKARIEKARITAALTEKKLPQKTPQAQGRSRTQNWEEAHPFFRRLLEHAQKTRQTPSRKRLSRTIDSRSNTGVQRRIPIDRILNEGSVEDILYKVDRLVRAARWMGITPKTPNGRFRIWFASIHFSQFGEHLYGSGNTILDTTGLEFVEEIEAAQFFQIAHDSTGIWNTYEGMIEALRTLLQDTAAESRNVVFLHDVKVMNFDLKRRP